VGVSCFEWVQDFQRFFWDQTEVVDRLFRILENAWTQVLNMGRRQRIPLCLAALSLGGIKRLQQSKRVRGLFP
jgi:glutamate dehydrogenase (NAD(P)+)